MKAIKSKGILAGVAALLIFVLIGVGLYLLGGDDQSALERLRDIAVIFVVLTSTLAVIFLAGITVALILLFMQLKDKAMPILDETTGTINRIRGSRSRPSVRPTLTRATGAPAASTRRWASRRSRSFPTSGRETRV